ncbi:MAG: hypothetical protein DRJ66_01570 [Thermoprotei archaeon]|nr:MAG: hypothetical protein DRJ66_01570 [Thermoprotei archaeon]RLF20846.1 MAG: hypothetical protein DRZ82_01030 [Thermoprotei archaeon]
MEYLSKVDKFILAYLWYEYGGSTYFSRGSQSPEEFLARFILDDIFSGRRPGHYQQLFSAIVSSIKKLTEYWIVQISGYDIRLTSFGQQVVKGISKEEYEKIKEELIRGKIS